MKSLTIYKRPKNDPTAWELYEQEHPDWSFAQRMRGFILLNLGMMIIILGAVWWLQHLQTVLWFALFIGAIWVVRKVK